MRSHELQSADSQHLTTDNRPPTSGIRPPIVVILWLSVVFIGYAGLLGSEILAMTAGLGHAPAFTVDLLLPAYAVMIVSVVLGLMRHHGPEAGTIRSESRRTDRGGSSHGR